VKKEVGEIREKYLSETWNLRLLLFWGEESGQ
jgi:hypothetical protein